MKRNGKYLLVPSMVWLAVFFVIPMLIVVAVSFASRTAYGQIVFGSSIYFHFWTDNFHSRRNHGMYHPYGLSAGILHRPAPPPSAAERADPLYDSFLDQFPYPLLCVGDHSPQPGRTEYDSDEAGSYFPADPISV